jgi:protein-L-isoaspartate(D-aspartate) O-methyltransferase
MKSYNVLNLACIFLLLFPFVLSECENLQMYQLTQNIKLHGMITSPVIESLYCSIDRKLFLRTESSIAYLDIPQDIGYGATISAPHMHAYALEVIYNAIKTWPKNRKIKVLDIGSGSGYL